MIQLCISHFFIPFLYYCNDVHHKQASIYPTKSRELSSFCLAGRDSGSRYSAFLSIKSHRQSQTLCY